MFVRTVKLMWCECKLEYTSTINPNVCIKMWGEVVLLFSVVTVVGGIVYCGPLDVKLRVKTRNIKE